MVFDGINELVEISCPIFETVFVVGLDNIGQHPLSVLCLVVFIEKLKVVCDIRHI